MSAWSTNATMVWLARDCKGKPPRSVLCSPYMQPHRAPAERSCGCADVYTYTKMGHCKDALWPRLNHNCFVGRAGLRGVAIASSVLPGDVTSVSKKNRSDITPDPGGHRPQCLWHRVKYHTCHSAPAHRGGHVQNRIRRRQALQGKNGKQFAFVWWQSSGVPHRASLA